MKIYTRTGDSGTTAIYGGVRVPKTDIRIAANGSLDELNSAIGAARAFLDSDAPYHSTLRDIQRQLMQIMSIVATPSELRESRGKTVAPEAVAELESVIDTLIGRLSGRPTMVLPGGCRAGAMLHIARTAARRAERELWGLNAEDSLPDVLLRYVNRLSDYLFVLARNVNMDAGFTDETLHRNG